MKLRDWDINLKVRLGGEAIVNITFWMFFPFLAIYFSEEFGKTLAGTLLVVSQAFAVVANLLGGYFSDRFGRKTMMVTASAGQGIAYLIFALSASPWLDSPVLGFICFSIVSIFSSFYWPASQAMIADVVPEKDRSSVFAIFYTSINIAVVIGPLLGSIFYADHRFELLLMAGITNLVLGLLLYKLSHETAPQILQGISSQSEGGALAILARQFKEYGIILHDRVFLLFILGGIFASMTFLQLDLLYPVYTKEVVHNQTLFAFNGWEMKVSGEQAFGILIAENGLLVVLFTVIVSKWMESFKERSVFVASSLCYGAAMLVAASTHWVWGLILSMAVFTFAELMTVGIQNNFISKIAPEHMRGQYFAAAGLRYTIGRMLAPMAITMTEWFGNSMTFIILFGFTVVSAFLYMATFRNLPSKTKAIAG